MERELLQRFNGDIHTREAFKAYLEQFIASEGIRRMYLREDVAHIADAKELIDKCFQQLEMDYGIPERKKETVNEAR